MNMPVYQKFRNMVNVFVAYCDLILEIEVIVRYNIDKSPECHTIAIKQILEVLEKFKNKT